jgi:flagellar hook-basal body complex protein FliE
MVISRFDMASVARIPNTPVELLNTGQTLPFSQPLSFRSEDGRIVQNGAFGADAVTRNGSFTDVMLGALDGVSAQQQLASQLHQAAIVDPDSVNVHDITIAQAQARMSLDITRTVLNRIVQGWRDLINTR